MLSVVAAAVINVFSPGWHGFCFYGESLTASYRRISNPKVQHFIIRHTVEFSMAGPLDSKVYATERRKIKVSA